MISLSNAEEVLEFEQQVLDAALCPTCGSAISQRQVFDRGIVHCPCGNCFVKNEAGALTYKDEIPETEYLGG